ncbi:hypothetical protein BLNAU_4099 [Blattamonas nauphoetae]|uniref:C2H2-type domain-containing protein n=1 Tax=Blattamonas nauphoetae TaxID=2049346 RepID=A0ABQ9YBA3_9EUKA|nr:hypothetical protein BLNAU_4099 [Blattamonas nauphoetae]
MLELHRKIKAGPNFYHPNLTTHFGNSQHLSDLLHRMFAQNPADRIDTLGHHLLNHPYFTADYPQINPNALQLPWMEFIQLKTGDYNPQSHQTVPQGGVETKKINQAPTTVEMVVDDHGAGTGWKAAPSPTTPTSTNNTLLRQTTKGPEPIMPSVGTTNRQNTRPMGVPTPVQQPNQINRFNKRQQERGTTGKDENGHGTGEHTVDDNQRWTDRDQIQVNTQEAPRLSTPTAHPWPNSNTRQENPTEEGLEPTQPLPSRVNIDLPPLSDPAPEPLPQTSSPSLELVTEPSPLQQQPAQNRFRRKAAKKEEKVKMTCQYCGVAVEIDQMEEHVQKMHGGDVEAEKMAMEEQKKMEEVWRWEREEKERREREAKEKREREELDRQRKHRHTEIICPFCDASMQRLAFITHFHQQHMTTRYSNTQIACPVCEARLSKRDFTSHLRSSHHTTLLLLSAACPLCNSDRQLSRMVSHMYRCYSRPETPLPSQSQSVKCPFCQKEMTFIELLDHIEKEEAALHRFEDNQHPNLRRDWNEMRRLVGHHGLTKERKRAEQLLSEAWRDRPNAKSSEVDLKRDQNSQKSESCPFCVQRTSPETFLYHFVNECRPKAQPDPFYCPLCSQSSLNRLQIRTYTSQNLLLDHLKQCHKSDLNSTQLSIDNKQQCFLCRVTGVPDSLYHLRRHLENGQPDLFCTHCLVILRTQDEFLIENQLFSFPTLDTADFEFYREFVC